MAALAGACHRRSRVPAAPVTVTTPMRWSGMRWSSPFTLGALAGGPALFKALGGEGASLANAVLYSNLVFGAAVPIWITNLLASALRGAGNVKVPAILTAAGAVLTLALSPPLILGWGPLPRLGVPARVTR